MLLSEIKCVSFFSSIFSKRQTSRHFIRLSANDISTLSINSKPLGVVVTKKFGTSKLIRFGSSPVKPAWSIMRQNASNQPVLTISIDGNISSGKSTLVSNLQEFFPKDLNFQVELVPEPLEKWTNLKGHNLLGMFYEDSVKNNFMFQHYVQLTRLIETMKAPPEIKSGDSNASGIVRIMERSLQNNRYCFTELARREGKLQQAEFAVLAEWHNWLEANFNLDLDLIIYLRTTPETVYNRMQQRGRAEESTVPFDYLSNLHETYEDWLIRGKLDSKPMVVQNQNEDGTGASNNGQLQQKVIVIDATKSKEEVAQECSDLLRKFMVNTGYSRTDETRKEVATKKRKLEDCNEKVLV